MITYKTPEDFTKMEAAGKVVSNIHYEIYDKTKVGMTLIDLDKIAKNIICLLYTSPSPRDRTRSRMPSSA